MSSPSLRLTGAAAAALLAVAPVLAQKANTWEIIGDAKVSAQQMFLGTANNVYIVDKTEDNPGQVNGHPAWAAEFDLTTGETRMLDIVTNSFCAGGIVLGDGRWINAGGNQAIGSGGVALNNADEDIEDVYDDADGGTALRVLTPCDDGTCDWIDDQDNWMNSRRWYPEVETLPEGDAIIIGGDQWGGFVDDAGQNNPTYEFFPKSDSRPAEDQNMQFLNDTLPVDLYPLTWLLPSGMLFIQAGWKAMIFDYVNNVEHRLPDIPDAVKVYPASGATSMLTQNKANNWTAPILFCGGSDVKDTDWTDHQNNVDWWINQHENAKTCVQITPNSTDAQWESLDQDDMPEARSMGQLIPLPDGRWFLVNGIEKGVAGYDASGIPYGSDPVYSPAYFDPNAKAGKRWTREGIPDASLPRLYHSSALLAPDGSVLTAGSNPYADFQVNGSMINAGDNSSDTEAEWWSETRLESFYPDYYDETRPSSFNISSISYGGDAMQVKITADELDGVESGDDVMAVLIRPGFSTHAINMGQRRIELETSLVKDGDEATLHVAPLPANPAVLAPGPCLLFKVIKGVPSQGTMVMIGNGELGQQPVGDYPELPETSGFKANTDSSDSSSNDDDSDSDSSSSSATSLAARLSGALALAFVVSSALL